MSDEYPDPPPGLSKSDPVSGGAGLWEVNRYFPEEEKDQAPRLAAPAVLLVHAATLGRRMFMEPEGGFLRHLLAERNGGSPAFDVYTLDWRSSNLLFRNWGEGGKDREPSEYRVDNVAAVDIREGIRAVAKHRAPPPPAPNGGGPVHVVAHCMGAAATAQAIAMQPDQDGELPLGHVVLATIALFYRLGVDGWMKLADDRFADLEAKKETDDWYITPHVVDRTDKKWPESLENMFQLWRQTVLAHGCGADFCDRLWFLYGGDFRSIDMTALHDRVGPGGLRAHFGALPVAMYRHIMENCRRGFAARWACPETDDEEFLEDHARFRDRGITLITGAENQVWHRDSIDRMYEWLRRVRRRDDPKTEAKPRQRVFRKRVFPRYGHLDLWWSSEAPREVYPYIVDALLDRLPDSAP